MMTFLDVVGLSAGGFVIAAFYMTDRIWLRWFAIASNILFLIYAAGMGLWPVFLLHGSLLPLNVVRLVQAHVSETRVGLNLTQFALSKAKIPSSQWVTR